MPLVYIQYSDYSKLLGHNLLAYIDYLPSILFNTHPTEYTTRLVVSSKSSGDGSCYSVMPVAMIFRKIISLTVQFTVEIVGYISSYVYDVVRSRGSLKGLA